MHHYRIKVRGFHCDLYGHVNNARYLEFLEEARWQILEDKIDLGEWERNNRSFVVVNINISYRRPARLNDVLNIASHVSSISRKSATINQKISQEEDKKLVAEADVTFAILNGNSGKSIPIEGEIKDQIATLTD